MKENRADKSSLLSLSLFMEIRPNWSHHKLLSLLSTKNETGVHVWSLKGHPVDPY